MRWLPLLCLLAACVPHSHQAFNAVQQYQQEGVIPSCSLFYEGLQFPDGSVVDQVEGVVVVVIIPDPRSAEGEDDHNIPCRKESKGPRSCRK